MLGHPVISVESALKRRYDRIVITMNNKTEAGVNNIFEVLQQLLGLGIAEDIIFLMADPTYLQEVKYKYPPRVQFLRNYASMITEDLVGNIAECGVFWGDFAALMNECFPKRKLYLFDTFEGWTAEDLKYEDPAVANGLTYDFSLYENTIRQEIPLLKCCNKNNVIITKGLVPETLSVCENEMFVFVNLDMDIYYPTISALHFFINKMVPGGIILVHDYDKAYPGIVQAVNEFAQETSLRFLPIGDGASVAFMIN